MVLGLAVSFYWKLIQLLENQCILGKIARRKMGVSLIAISGSSFLAAIINQEKAPILYMMRKPIIITYSSLTVV